MRTLTKRHGRIVAPGLWVALRYALHSIRQGAVSGAGKSGTIARAVNEKRQLAGRPRKAQKPSMGVTRSVPTLTPNGVGCGVGSGVHERVS